MRRRIRFLTGADIYNPGDIAGFPADVAALHVTRGRAVYDDEVGATTASDAGLDEAAEKAQRHPPADKQARPGKGGVVTK